jgi:hypothetical protein
MDPQISPKPQNSGHIPKLSVGLGDCISRGEMGYWLSGLVDN